MYNSVLVGSQSERTLTSIHGLSWPTVSSFVSRLHLASDWLLHNGKFEMPKSNQRVHGILISTINLPM